MFKLSYTPEELAIERQKLEKAKLSFVKMVELYQQICEKESELHPFSFRSEQQRLKNEIDSKKKQIFQFERDLDYLDSLHKPKLSLFNKLRKRLGIEGMVT